MAKQKKELVKKVIGKFMKKDASDKKGSEGKSHEKKESGAFEKGEKEEEGEMKGGFKNKFKNLMKK